ncbi:M48 family metallopeptidase [Undibacterium sp. RTI2.1]|uniref:M48 family metallopeptidase n=1 Tax=unclassified Undibacterium TaxID=2630295 RepID=UPI002AB4F060|nr:MULTISPECIES: M48 family metallopeptidase [unclassified Undibacterium]MDY7539983.1 M48 family metallopeptidase [Undibacterium sp. 5I1]MEB0032731.1 M48 family metallopeptidase [Undibacterium sp. RTI2.1]MEB0116495.1 M48 family metallopeptidase [Undibacterium sp. RTI2.2]MEB0232741.1 M48 family metallopeptidase [Undibacterium sp. 10I3]MEB0257289.1 M48 family metallopeptidase [Undibacterium sp. 5I1]
MDFFEQQDQAHRQSKKLLFLFFLAVVAIVLAVNLSLALVWIWSSGQRFAGVHHYPRGFFILNTFLTLLFIGGGTLVEMFRLRDGGDAVAQLAGGRLVMPSSQDLQERRLLNIVEEMALASGIACPRVYVMDHEEAINAFAAGYHQNEAVVAVTRGTLVRLTRDELQGVIGHEFSHILNGDMRMNIKLIGMLFGIQMIASFGQQLMYWGSSIGSSRSRDEKGPSLQTIFFLTGVALFVIGYVGIFFGRLIKSAVSRQREFLADASAVQFTRNPESIGGALRKIGGLTLTNQCGSRIDSPHAEQLSHMFLGAARPNLLDGFFATHPPLKERLQRLYGWNVEFLDASEIIDVDAGAGLPDGVYGFGARNFMAAQAATNNSVPGSSLAIIASPGAARSDIAASDTKTSNLSNQLGLGFGNLPSSKNRMPSELLDALRDPLGVSAAVYALLLDRSDTQAYAIQTTILQQSAAAQSALALSLLPHIEAMPCSARLPLLDLAMPALKLLSVEQRASLLAIVSRLIAADQKMTQAEFVLQTVLDRRLGPLAGRAVPVRFGQLAALKKETALLLSLVAYTASGKDTAAFDARDAFLRAANSMPDLGLNASDMCVINTAAINTAPINTSAAVAVSVNAPDFFEVKRALDKLNQLAPLAKPFLIRLLVAAAALPGERLNPDSADLLRCICAAIDAPVPQKVGEFTL